MVVRSENFEQDMKDKKANFIDLFILMNYPDSLLRRILMYPFIGFELLPHLVIDRTGSKIVKGLFYGMMHVSRKIVRLFSSEKASRYNIRGVEVGKWAWNKEWFGTPIIHDFEDTVIPIPCDCDSILTAMYGDYMTPPPEDKRTGAGSYPYSLYEDYMEDVGKAKKHPRLSQDVMPR